MASPSHPAGIRHAHLVGLLTVAAVSYAPATICAAQPAPTSAPAGGVATLPASATPVVAAPVTRPSADDPASERAARKSRRARRRAKTRRRRRAHTTGAVTVFGRRARRAKLPGSAHAVNKKQLERHKTDDIHRGLAEVPGVYVREEDGYGLRPNIGMRGASSERSAKVTLMEDGVLIAPAPYAAPAAYYFPLVARMSGLEVIKGPAGIRFGPSTVGGAVNLVSAPIPKRRKLLVDLAGGTTWYGKAHLGYGDRTKHAGWWVEGVGLRSSGFKELDGGGPTGFAKWEGVAKLHLNTDQSRATRHTLDLRVDASDETSHETYTGLTDADFEANPWRRYRGTRDDLLTWRRVSGRVRYGVEGERAGGGEWSAHLTLYRSHFDRTWAKLAGFSAGKSLGAVLDKPTAGANAVLYGVLTGANDSTDASEALVLGTNARGFVSQGAQADFATTWTTGEVAARPVTHEIVAGVRLHSDAVERKATEDTRLMQGGALVSAGLPTATLRDATAGALALAAWVQDTVQLGRVRVSAGLRLEHVRTSWVDHLDADREDKADFTAVIPGVGVLVEASKRLGLVVGVHRGFSPVSPGQAPETQPESSWNFEAGARYNRRRFRAEIMGFFNDYSNLKGTCTFSSGCAVGVVGQEFNGGRVWIWGAEATAGVLLGKRKGLRVPVSLTYTLTQSSFQTGFVSTNPQWGQVAVGDALPYVPVHQGALNTGVRAKRWELALTARGSAPMRDVASQGDDARFTDTTLVFDAALNVKLGRHGKAYVTGRNLADSAQVVSYRPFGARPGMRRLLMVGYKHEL